MATIAMDGNADKCAVYLDKDVHIRWVNIGTALGVSTDSLMASFLLRQFEAVQAGVMSETPCLLCQRPLFCGWCNFQTTKTVTHSAERLTSTGSDKVTTEDGKNEKLNEDQRKPEVPPPSTASAKTTGGKYVPPSMRAGANKGRRESMASQRKDEAATIRVTNLSEDTRESDLQELFRPFGPISRIYLAKDKITGQSKGFAFISFCRREDAARAVAGVSGFGYDHLVLKVEMAKCEAVLPGVMSETPCLQCQRPLTLFCGWCNFQTTKTVTHSAERLTSTGSDKVTTEDGKNEKLNEDQRKPEVPPPSTVSAKTTGRKYVPFSMRDGANKGRRESMASQRKDEAATIRVTNLSENARESDLQELFRPFGHISRIYLAKDKITGQSKGFAFISFHRREDAARAIAGFFGYDHLVLKVEWAKPAGQQ